jgi:hypothetical protein
MGPQMKAKTKHYYAHMSSVRRAIKKHLPNASDIPVFRELIEGRVKFSVWF